MASKMYEFLLVAAREEQTFELQDSIAGLKNVRAALFDLVERATESGFVVLRSKYCETGSNEWVEWPALGPDQQIRALNNRVPDPEAECEARVRRAHELREAVSTALTELIKLCESAPDDGVTWEWRDVEAGSTSYQRRRVDGSFGERCARSAMLLASLAEFSIAHPDETCGIKGFYPVPR